MPNLEKVIKGLEEAFEVIAVHVPERYWGYSLNACKEAQTMLKAQEPEETRLVRHYSRPNVYADLWLHCEKCGGRVDNRYKPKFCTECGRKVKWK